MKKLLLTVAALATAVATGVVAQSSGTASSTTMSTLNSTVDGRTYIDGRTLIDQRGGGDSTIRNAPQVSAPSMSSGHPCAYTPASASLSIIGGGIGAGGQKIDDACLLGQLGERNASVQMIAARNPDACKALRAAGRISARSTCTSEETRAAKNAAQPAATSSRSTKAATVASLPYSRCELTARGIEVRVARGGTRETAVAACRSTLGY